MQKSKTLKNILIFNFFLGLTNCATVWKERDKKWQPKGKKALLASYTVKPLYKGSSLTIGSLSKAVTTGKDTHRYAGIGAESTKLLLKYFKTNLKLEVKINSERAKKMESFKIKTPDVLKTAMHLMEENWIHPKTSKKDFHSGNIPLKGNKFTNVAKLLRGKDKNEVFISAGIRVKADTTWLFWSECVLDLRFRIISNKGKPVYQAESTAKAGFTFFGAGDTTENCSKALKIALKDLKNVEERKGLSKFK